MVMYANEFKTKEKQKLTATYIYIPFEMMNIWIYYIWTAECLCLVILALSKLRSLDVGYILPIPSFGLVVELSARKVL